MTNSDYILTKAKDKDIAELINFLISMHEESTTLYPQYNKNLMVRFIKPIILDELCLVIKYNKKIIGAIGGQVRRWWFSENQYLGDAFCYVSPKHRSFKNASLLLKGFNNIAEKKLIPCMVGTLDGNDVDRKDQLYNKLNFRRIGSTFANGV